MKHDHVFGRLRSPLHGVRPVLAFLGERPCVALACPWPYGNTGLEAPCQGRSKTLKSGVNSPFGVSILAGEAQSIQQRQSFYIKNVQVHSCHRL